MIKEYPQAIEEYPSEDAQPSYPQVALSAYDKAKLAGNVDTSGGPFGPANPAEVLALAQVPSIPAAILEKTGIPQSLEEVGADVMQKLGVNPAAQPGVPMFQDQGNTPPSPFEQAFPGLAKGIEEGLRSFTTPGMALVAAPAVVAGAFPKIAGATEQALVRSTGGIPVAPAVAKMTAQAFKVQMAAGIPDALQNLAAARTPEEVGRAGTQLGAALAPFLHEAVGAVRGREIVDHPPIADQQIAAAGAPATAAALTATEEATQNAIQSKSAQVLRTVQDQPKQGAGEVPPSKGGSETSERGSEAEQQQKKELLDLTAGTTEQAKQAGQQARSWQEDRTRYDQLVDEMKTKPSQSAWVELEEIKNRWGGKPPPAEQETITAAAFQDEGLTYTGPNHPEILDRIGVSGFETPESRNTPQFGFFTNKKRFITREEAGPIAEAAGQNLKHFEPQEPVHSDEVRSTAEPAKALGDVSQSVAAVPTEELEPEAEPALQGMGGGIAGEFPEPRQAAVAGATTEQAPPQDRPMGIISNFGQGLREGLRAIDTFLKGAAGETLPKTTKADRLTGEAGARFLSSRIAALPLADSFVARVLQDTNVDPVKFGALLTEDNLMSVRESLRQAAFEENGKGNSEKADKLMQQAQHVATILGSDGSPLGSLDDMLDYASDPMVQRALAQHRQLWQEVIDPQYKAARGLDSTVELASRGLNTGARINLKAVKGLIDEDVGKAINASSGLTGTFKRKSPFSFRAKGSGETYDINYQHIIRNTFQRQLEIAAKNAFEDKLIDSGNAVLESSVEPVTFPDGEGTVSFPSRRGFVSQNLYVRQSLANEYKSAANVDQRAPTNPVSKFIGLLNKFALAGLTDGTVHISNQLTALFNRPATGNLLADSLLSATGRADIPVIMTKAVLKAFQNNRDQLAQLAEIGALRAERTQTGIFGGRMGKLLEKTDQLTRLLLDDTFQSLVDQKVVEDTETNRREYVNQIGQYNRRAQGWLMRTLRDTGLGPFATAGRTFNAMGVKMVTLSPGVRGSTAFAETALRANVLSKWIGAAVGIGTLNWLLTKDKGGGFMGRPGTKLGDVDLGLNDKKGNQLSLPVASIIGVGRGLRVTGIKGAIDAKRMGLTNADALDAASRDIINSWAGPAAGPAVKFGAVAATGYPAAVKVGRASPVAPPGESQLVSNVWEAMKQTSPVIQTYLKIKNGASLQEILSTQLPRLSPNPGKTEATVRNYPHIVQAAQANEFIDYVVHETRRTDPEKRLDYAQQQIDRLPPEFKKKAWDELKRRKVFAQ